MSRSNLRFQIDRLGQEYVAELIKKLISLDKVASGNLIDSLDYEVSETVDKIILKVIWRNYFQ